MPVHVQSIRLTHHDEPPSFTTAEQAEPADGEVLVRMSHAGVNPLDTYVAAGQVAGDAPLPRTLGVEGSGYVDGQPVVVHGCGVGIARDGTWATQVTAPAAAVVPVPDGVDMAQAAVCAVAGRTALRVARDLARIGDGDRVLVLGAAGGVGSAVTALAKSFGAKVWGCTADPGKAEFIASLGATPLVCGAAELAETAAPADPTVVLDPLGGPYTGAALRVLAPHGRHVVYGASAGAEVRFDARDFYRGGRTVIGYGGIIETPEETRAAIGDALALLAAGRWRIPVCREVPLHRTSEALAALAARELTGKAVLTVPRT